MIRVGGKEYNYIMSVAVSEAFSKERKKMDSSKDEKEYSLLVIATLRQAIHEYYYSKSWINRAFNGWIANLLTPSVDYMYHSIEPREVVRLVAEINGVSIDEVKKMATSKKKK